MRKTSESRAVHYVCRHFIWEGINNKYEDLTCSLPFFRREMLAIGKEQRTELADTQSLLKQNIQIYSYLYFYIHTYINNTYIQSLPKYQNRKDNSIFFCYTLKSFEFENKRWIWGNRSQFELLFLAFRPYLHLNVF